MALVPRGVVLPPSNSTARTTGLVTSRTVSSPVTFQVPSRAGSTVVDLNRKVG